MLYRKDALVIMFIFILVLIVVVDANALNYRSKPGGGDYNDKTTWEVQNPKPPPDWKDAERAPDLDDDVVIQPGHTVWVLNDATANAKNLTVKGYLSGFLAGDVDVNTVQNLIVTASGKVTSNATINKTSGNVKITAGKNAHIDGHVKTGDATGQDGGTKGANSGDIKIKGNVVIKTPGCKIKTGNAGKGKDGQNERGGDGGNSGSVTLNGTGGKVGNGEKHYIEIGRPGDGGNGKPPGNRGKRGKINEGGNIIIVCGLPVGPDHSVMTARLITFWAVDSIVYSSMAESSIVADDAICISVVDGTLDFRGCVPNSFIASRDIYVSASEIITDPGVTINDLMDPDPKYDVCGIPTLTEWGMIIFGVVLLGFITWVFLRRRRTAISLQ